MKSVRGVLTTCSFSAKRLSRYITHVGLTHLQESGPCPVAPSALTRLVMRHEEKGHEPHLEDLPLVRVRDILVFDANDLFIREQSSVLLG